MKPHTYAFTACVVQSSGRQHNLHDHADDLARFPPNDHRPQPTDSQHGETHLYSVSFFPVASSFNASHWVFNSDTLAFLLGRCTEAAANAAASARALVSRTYALARSISVMAHAGSEGGWAEARELGAGACGSTCGSVRCAASESWPCPLVWVYGLSVLSFIVDDFEWKKGGEWGGNARSGVSVSGCLQCVKKGVVSV